MSSTDVEKLNRLLVLADTVSSNVSGIDLAAKIQRIIEEPYVHDIRVTNKGYGTVMVNGMVCAIVPQAKLKTVHGPTNELVLDALHELDKNRDADKAFDDAN